MAGAPAVLGMGGGEVNQARYLALDSVCKPLVSTDQFDQRAPAPKR